MIEEVKALERLLEVFPRFPFKSVNYQHTENKSKHAFRYSSKMKVWSKHQILGCHSSYKRVSGLLGLKKQNSTVQVCKTMFYNTLSVGEGIALNYGNEEVNSDRDWSKFR